jgi:NifB/MoaA-like Fe-S oxidoreductase
VVPALRAIQGLSVRLVVVENRFYGASVTCAGLLAGEDIARALAAAGRVDAALLPGNVVNAEGLFVDDVSLDSLAARTRTPLHLERAGLAALFEEAGFGARSAAA